MPDAPPSADPNDTSPRLIRPQRLRALLPSQIRENMRIAAEVGAINLAQGRPDFPAAPAVKLAAIEAIAADRNQYSVTWGVAELRRAVAETLQRRYGIDADPEREVTITCGVTEGMVAALLATIDSDDEVVIIEPAHENYVPAVRFAGGVPRFVTLRPPDFAIDGDELEQAISPRTRMVVLNTPHNPSGRVFAAEELETVARVVRRHGLLLLTDEIYDQIVYDGRRHEPPAALDGMRRHAIITGGISKIYAVTGWRLGYVVAPPEVTAALRTVHDYLTICAPTPLQHAAITALALPERYYDELRVEFSARRQRMMQALAASGFSARTPEGAYYVMASFDAWGFEGDAAAFTRMLIREARVAVVQGPAFYYGRPEVGQRLVRFAFAKTLDTLDEVERRLREAYRRLGGG